MRYQVIRTFTQAWGKVIPAGTTIELAQSRAKELIESGNILAEPVKEEGLSEPKQKLNLKTKKKDAQHRNK